MRLQSSKAKRFLSAVLALSLALSVPATAFAEETSPTTTPATTPATEPETPATEPTTPASEPETPAAEEEESLVATFALTRAAPVEINPTNFPDAALRQFLTNNFDINPHDGYLDANELAHVTWIDLSDSAATDLTGIELLPELSWLNLNRCPITDVDVSGLEKLAVLSIEGSAVESLNISGCTAMTELYFGGTETNKGPLTSLNASGCTTLTKLCVGDNQLTTLNVAGCTALEELFAAGNQLANLDVSSCTALKDLNVYQNQLTNLNASGCTALNNLVLGINQLSNLNVSGTALTSLSVRNMGTLTSLNVSGCTKLETLDVSKNKLSSLDVASCTNLKELRCAYNALISLDVSACAKLETLDAAVKYGDKGALTSLDASGCSNLKSISACGNPFSAVDVSGCTALTYLDVSGPGKTDRSTLSSLDVSTCTKLDTLMVSSADLQSLDVSSCPALTHLNFYLSEIGQIDLTHNPDLIYLVADAAAMDSLDVSKNTKLKELHVASNHNLTTLDVTHNPDLELLYCQYNALTSLDLSNNTKLTELYCQYNKIPTLDLSHNPSITKAKSGLDQFVNAETSFENGVWQVKMADLVGSNTANVTVAPATGAGYANGIVTLGTAPGTAPANFTYNYRTAPGTTALPMLVTVALKQAAPVTVDATTFPDQALRSYVTANFDTDGDGKLNFTELYNVTAITIADDALVDLKGIEQFSNLQTLDIRSDGVAHLDITKNPELKNVQFTGNGLVDINAAGCTKLDELYVVGKSLTDKSALTGVNLSGCSNLTKLTLINARLSNLDVRNCTALKALNVSGNKLATLDVSANTGLEVLDCGHNEIAAVDLSKNTELVWLELLNNKLTQLNIGTLAKLTYLDVSENSIAKLDLSGSPKLEALDAFGAHISELDVSSCNDLMNLDIRKNDLTELDLSHNKELDRLNVSENRLTKLDVSNNTKLTELICAGNQIPALDLSHNPGIATFNMAQSITVKATFADGKWQVNMANVVGAANTGKVAIITGETYANGIVSLGSAAAPDSDYFNYTYSTGGKPLDVKVLLTYDVQGIKTDPKPEVVVSDPLKSTPYNTPEKIVEKLTGQLTGFASFPVTAGSNLKTMEVYAYLVTAGGDIPLTAANMPASGIEITLPYPAGTNGNGFNFVVVHMMQNGSVEQLTPTLKADGIHVTVTSLSPFGIAWEAKQQTGSHDKDDGADDDTPATSAPANINDPSVYYNIKTWVTVGGVITPSASVQEGGSMTIIATPATGYRLVKLVVDGVDVGAVTSYTLNNMHRNHEIGAYFDKAAGTTAGAAKANGIIPQTSDDSPLLLWVCLMALALAGVVTLLVVRRRKSSK